MVNIKALLFILCGQLLLSSAPLGAVDFSLVSRAMQKAGSMAKNVGSSVVQTVKSDLGIGGRVNTAPSSFMDNVKQGARLFCYEKIMTFAAFCILQNYVDFKSVPPQFEPGDEPSFLKGVVIVPIIEELFFTHWLNGLMGKNYGPLIVPLIFGALHKGIFTKLCTTIYSFIAIRHLRANPNSRYASIIAHMMNNGLAYYVLMNKKLRMGS